MDNLHHKDRIKDYQWDMEYRRKHQQLDKKIAHKMLP